MEDTLRAAIVLQARMLNEMKKLGLDGARAEEMIRDAAATFPADQQTNANAFAALVLEHLYRD